MLVYLKFDKLLQEFPEVSLENCCRPSIGRVHEGGISPAIWFKSLVVHSIFIDCDLREVYWSRDSSHPFFHSDEPLHDKLDVVMKFFHSKEQIFKENQLYSFDPDVQEMFDSAYRIIMEYQNVKSSEDECVELHKQVLRLLHCFVLPAIKFFTKDLSCLKYVLTWIEKQLTDIDTKIQMKDNSKRNTENSLKKQRERILTSDTVSTSLKIERCSLEFLHCILPHIVKDKAILNEEYVALEKQKELIAKSDSAEDQRTLEIVRKTRDEAYAALERVITVRENIQNVIQRPHVRKSVSKSKRMPEEVQPFHNVYLEISRRVQEDCQEIKDLILCKVKITSVKEAVKLAIREVEEDGQSYGYHRRVGTSEMETDMFDPNKKPEEWQTLQEKVNVRLQLKPLGFQARLRDFCEDIRIRCQQILDEAKLFSIEGSHAKLAISISPETAAALSVAGNYKRRSVMIPASSACLPENSIQICVLKKLCTDINDHIWYISSLIAEEIYKDAHKVSSMDMNKVYICYELHVSSQLLFSISRIYENYYKTICQTLWIWLQTVSLDDLGFNDLHITSMITPHPEPEPKAVLPPRDHSWAQVRQPDTADHRWGPGHLNKMSLTDLYNIAEIEGQEIPASFDGALNYTPFNDEDPLHSSEECQQREECSSVFNKRDSQERGESQSTSTNSEDEFLVYDVDTLNMDGSQRLTVSQYVSDVDNNHAPLPPDVQLPEGSQAHSEVEMRRFPRGSRRTVGQSGVLYSLADTDDQRDSIVQEHFFKAFDKFESFLDAEDKACTLFRKVKELQNAVSYVSNQIQKLRDDSGKKHEPVSSDDLVSVFVLLLSRLKMNRLHKLYSHLNLIIHLLPKFMQGSASDFALTTFEGALLHLKEQSVLQRSSNFTC